MIQRVLNSKNFLALVLAILTGTLLYFKMPWPLTESLRPLTWNDYYLRLIAAKDPWTYAALKSGYRIMLYTTPFIGYSFLFSALYIFSLGLAGWTPLKRCHPIRQSISARISTRLG